MGPAIERGMGWIPDVPSPKDYSKNHPEIAALLSKTRLAELSSGLGEAGAEAGGTGLPRKVDLRDTFSPVEDQGRINACTANAVASIVEYMERRALGRHIDASRMFLYKVTRNLMGRTGDLGGSIRSALGAIACFGAPPEQFWPYDPSPAATNPRVNEEPPAFCYAFAENFRAVRYYRLDTPGLDPCQLLATAKMYLAAQIPCIFGLPVFDEFKKPLAGALIPLPASSSRLYGGHAVVAAGYDDDLAVACDQGALLVRNSWGTGWGDGGYGWITYRYIMEGITMDWWVIVKQAWVDTGQFE